MENDGEHDFILEFKSARDRIYFQSWWQAEGLPRWQAVRAARPRPKFTPATVVGTGPSAAVPDSDRRFLAHAPIDDVKC